jgi:hypothetical protein
MQVFPPVSLCVQEFTVFSGARKKGWHSYYIESSLAVSACVWMENTPIMYSRGEIEMAQREFSEWGLPLSDSVLWYRGLPLCVRGWSTADL